MPISVTDGIRMSPVPRTTEASVLTSQIEIAPENSTCEYCMRLFEHAAAPAEQRVERPAEHQHDGGEEQSGAGRPIIDGMQRQRRRAVAVAGADRAADRGGNAAAHRAGRHHLRQHDEGKHQRDRRPAARCRAGRYRRFRRRPPAWCRPSRSHWAARASAASAGSARSAGRWPAWRNCAAGRMSSGASMVMRHRSIQTAINYG